MNLITFNFTKVLEYAIKNGYVMDTPDSISLASDAAHYGLYMFWYGDQILYYSIKDIIFSHSFAKAVFGEYLACCFCNGSDFIPGRDDGSIEDDALCVKGCCDGIEISWIYNIQQAIISKDPVNYYYQFICKK